MLYIRAAIITTLLLLGLLVGYVFVTFDSDYELNMAYESFLKGDYDKALAELNPQDDLQTPGRLALYQAYIYRAKRQMRESDDALTRAGFQARKHHQPNLLLEIYLNQALNAYVENNENALKAAFDNAFEISRENPWVEFFKALIAYNDERYQDALELWSRPYNRVPLSGWMRKAFDEVFTRLWLVRHIARCQIETGKYLIARQSLEQELKGVTGEDATDIDFLIGLSYAKEAQDKPLNAAAPYYKLALSYLNRVPIQQERYTRERQRLLAQLQKNMHELISAHSYSDLPFYASVLDAWHAKAELNAAGQELVGQLEHELSTGNRLQIKEITALLHRLLPDGEIRERLEQRFNTLASEALPEGKLDQAKDFWEAAQLFSRDPTNLNAQFANKIAARILAMSTSANGSVDAEMPYFTLWQSAAKSKAERLAFAKQLVAAAGNLWMQPGDNEKALQIMKIALTLPEGEDRQALKQALEESLNNRYAEAVAQDNIEQLPRLYLAMQTLELQGLHIRKEEEIPRQLSIAEKLIQEKAENKAAAHLQWILTLEPQNQQARLLAGKLLYLKGDYAKALPYLAAQPNPDADLKEQIAVSQLLTGLVQEGEKQLEEVAAERPLSLSALKRLGLGFLIQNNPAAGKEWLEKIPDPDSETLIGLAYAAWLAGDWANVEDILQKVKAPYSNLDSLQGMMIRSDMALKQPVKAEQLLTALLARRVSPPIATASPEFIQFEEQVLKDFNRFFVAGLFFENIKQNPDIALKYLDLLKDPTPEMRLLRGQVLLKLHEYAQAIQGLQQAYAQTKQPALMQRISPLLGQALAATGRQIEAFQWYRRFFEANPESLSHRAEYAQLLMQLRRFDLANEQWKILSNGRKLSPDEEVRWIQSLTSDGLFDEAIATAKPLLEAQSPLTAAQQLMLSQQMVITGHQELAWPLFKRLPPIEKLSGDETRELLKFLLLIGSYDQAITLTNSRRDVLDKDPAGLLAVAQLFLRLGQPEEALKRGEEALHLDPENPDVQSFLTRHTRDFDAVQKKIQVLEAELDKDKDALPAQIAYTRAVNDAARVAERIGQHPISNLKSDLQRAAFLLDQILTEIKAIPELYYLLGQMQRYLGNSEAAVEAYLIAAKLDSSYTDPLFGLVKIYRQKQDLHHAIAVLYQVTRYSPDNANAWRQLAELYVQEGYLFEASTFYQNAIKFHPNELADYLALGKLFLELRNPEDARVVLAHAIKIDPNNVEVLKLLLTTLLDSALATTTEDTKALAAEQTAVYQRLHALDPEAAKKLMDEFKMSTMPNSLDLGAPPPGDLKSTPLFLQEHAK